MPGIDNAPLPAIKTLLSDLPEFSAGTKVRFLGCVKAYTTNSATLTLEHNYPPRKPGQLQKPLKVQVDVELLLTTMKAHETRVGEWVNVIGYITANPRKGPEQDTIARDDSEIRVQALVLWSAGTFDLHGYEKILDLEKKDRNASDKNRPTKESTNSHR
ncbi:hypothetical protein HYFRA_00001021 [Hymenoscyphus fraxineus]|uniref:Uncharacterized protein n=1 Tax=Hymenoscyphus fraxineus TaxID=746836 RepID=A0A9N9PQN4_9HELO|nr:hypothetical protein HYFRA_00001021 [Hymenoscyphus fraxineus]